MKKKLQLLFSILLVAFAGSWLTKELLILADTLPISTAAPQTDQAVFLVSRIIDGDTIELESGQVVRYIGIDTPETKHPQKGIECFGQEAAQRNNELVLGQTVVLEHDVNQTDRYGRILAYVYLADGTMINEQLVAEGFAQSSAYPPDVKHQTLLDEAEATARAEKKGLWNDCVTLADPSQIDPE